jgi:hypothetical protein
MQNPLDATLMGSNTIQRPKAKIRRRNTKSDSGRQLPLTIPDDSR